MPSGGLRCPPERKHLLLHISLLGCNEIGALVLSRLTSRSPFLHHHPLFGQSIYPVNAWKKKIVIYFWNVFCVLFNRKLLRTVQIAKSIFNGNLIKKLTTLIAIPFVFKRKISSLILRVHFLEMWFHSVCIKIASYKRYICIDIVNM